MKIITWNVNGLRACIKKGLIDFLRSVDADIIALQETKGGEVLRPQLSLPGYFAEWNNGQILGYSGTVCLFKKRPMRVFRGFGDEKFDKEGRLVTLEYPSFFFANVYVPMSQGSRERWHHRLEWDAAFVKYLSVLQKHKPVILFIRHRDRLIYCHGVRQSQRVIHCSIL